MRIVIYGAPRSKKNNRRNFGHISLPSKAYEEFKVSALWQLKKYKMESISNPIWIDYQFYQKGKMRQDIDNAQSSVNDILQDAGIIDDDNLIVRVSAIKLNGCNDWETILEIKEI